MKKREIRQANMSVRDQSRSRKRQQEFNKSTLEQRKRKFSNLNNLQRLVRHLTNARTRKKQDTELSLVRKGMDLKGVGNLTSGVNEDERDRRFVFILFCSSHSCAKSLRMLRTSSDSIPHREPTFLSFSFALDQTYLFPFSLFSQNCRTLVLTTSRPRVTRLSAVLVNGYPCDREEMGLLNERAFFVFHSCFSSTAANLRRFCLCFLPTTHRIAI